MTVQLVYLPSGGAIAGIPGSYAPGIYQTDSVARSATLVSPLTLTSSQQITITRAATTFLVAASNANITSKASADYLCTGTNDHLVIQAAINALNLSGEARQGTIILSEGTYAIGGTIQIPSHVQIFGSGWETKLIANNGLNAYMIQLLPYVGAGNQYLGCEGVRISNLFMDGNAPNQTAGGIIDGYGARMLTVEHCHLTRPYDVAILLRANSDGSFAQQNYIHDCYFDYGNSSAGNGQGIRCVNSDENNIVSNKFQFMGGTAGTDPCCIYDNAGLNSYVDNKFVNSTNGIHIYFQEGCRMVGNIFDGCAGDSIKMDGSAHVVTGNSFYKIGIQGTAGTARAVYMSYNCQNCNIAGNVFTNDSGTPECFIKESTDGNSGNTWLVGNNVIEANNFVLSSGATFPPVKRNTLPSSLIRHNQGYVTEASGTATVAAAATTVTITHGLSLTPTNVHLTLQSSPGAATSWWVPTANITSTTFIITVNAAPGGSGAVFMWEAKVL